MKKIVRKAIKISVAKYQAYADDEKLRWSSLDLGPADCALCDIFFNDECDGCPVAEESGRVKCENTPYDDLEELVEDLSEATEFGSAVVEEVARTAVRDKCREEAEFLRSLLPE